jgi:DNA (cytosine-5)-methyltransferase 1
VKRLSLQLQIKMLKESLSAGVQLADILANSGYTFDSLIYRHNPPHPTELEPYQTLEDFAFSKHDVPVVSFFSGAGGLDLGFHAAGFHHLASFESNPLFCATLRSNRPSWKVFNQDLSERDHISAILDELLGTTYHFDGVFHGGPPCQTFSIAANQRFSKSGSNFKRVGFSHERLGTLLFDYIFYILRYRPRAFLIENVPGLAEIDAGVQLSQTLTLLSDAGYSISTPKVVNAMEYGVPQDRKRLIIVGARNSRGIPTLPRRSQSSLPVFKALEKPVDGLPNHVTREHTATSVLRYMELRCGQRDHMGRVDRLDPTRPSKTVIAGGTGGGGRSHLHPEIPRTLSAREGARIQTFPDDYEFCGPPARQMTQVGNAVPPIMAMKLARHIFEQFYLKPHARKALASRLVSEGDRMLRAKSDSAHHD